MSSIKASYRLHDIVLLWIPARRFLDDPVTCHQLKRQTAYTILFYYGYRSDAFRRSGCMSSIKASDRCTTFLLWIPVRRLLDDPVRCHQLRRQTAYTILFYYG